MTYKEEPILTAAQEYEKLYGVPPPFTTDEQKEQLSLTRVSSFLYNGGTEYAEISVDTRRRFHFKKQLLGDPREAKDKKHTRDFGRYSHITFAQIDTNAVTSAYQPSDAASGTDISITIIGEELRDADETYTAGTNQLRLSLDAANLLPIFSTNYRNDNIPGGITFMKRQDGLTHTGFLIEDPDKPDKATIFLFTPRPPLPVDEAGAVIAQQVAEREPDAAEDFFMKLGNAFLAGLDEDSEPHIAVNELREEFEMERATGTNMQFAVARIRVITNALTGQKDFLDSWLPQRHMGPLKERLLRSKEQHINLIELIKDIIITDRPKPHQPPVYEPPPPPVPDEQKPDRGMDLQTAVGVSLWDYIHKRAKNVHDFDFARGTDTNTRNILFDYMKLIKERVAKVKTEQDLDAIHIYQDAIVLLEEVIRRTQFADMRIERREVQEKSWLEAIDLFKPSPYDHTRFDPILIEMILKQWVTNIAELERQAVNAEHARSEIIFDATAEKTDPSISRSTDPAGGENQGM